jgi:hypothetical protein
MRKARPRSQLCLRKPRLKTKLTNTIFHKLSSWAYWGNSGPKNDRQ